MAYEYPQAEAGLIQAGRRLHGMGIVPATSGNLSARLANGHVAITVSGTHKGELAAADIMEVDANGRSLDARRPSAETLLHIQIYRRDREAGVVLHPHSVNATVLSQLRTDHLHLGDYELLKAFPGVDTHECSVVVPIFDNDQDIDRLSALVDRYMDENDNVFGYLIRGHGFYTWGRDFKDALRHVEAFEFLFDCELRKPEGMQHERHHRI